jgi:hypothetical protein
MKRLVGEGGDESNMLVVERLRPAATHYDYTDWASLAQ